MACGCGGQSTPQVESVETAQAAADRRRQANRDTVRRERESQQNAVSNAST